MVLTVEVLAQRHRPASLRRRRRFVNKEFSNKSKMIQFDVANLARPGLPWQAKPGQAWLDVAWPGLA